MVKNRTYVTRFRLNVVNERWVFGYVRKVEWTGIL